MHEFYKIVLIFNGFLLLNSLFLFLFSPSLFLFTFSFFFHHFSFFFPFSIHQLTKSLNFFFGGAKSIKKFFGGHRPRLPPLGDATDFTSTIQCQWVESQFLFPRSRLFLDLRQIFWSNGCQFRLTNLCPAIIVQRMERSKLRKNLRKIQYSYNCYKL